MGDFWALALADAWGIAADLLTPLIPVAAVALAFVIAMGLVVLLFGVMRRGE